MHGWDWVIVIACAVLFIMCAWSLHRTEDRPNRLPMTPDRERVLNDETKRQLGEFGQPNGPGLKG